MHHPEVIAIKRTDSSNFFLFAVVLKINVIHAFVFRIIIVSREQLKFVSKNVRHRFDVFPQLACDFV